MKKITIILPRYNEGSASTNRILAYVKGFSELGMFVRIIFLMASSDKKKCVISLPNVIIENIYLGYNAFINRYSKLAYIKGLFTVRAKVYDDDNVFLYSPDLFLLISIFLIKKKIQIYSEFTEHPYNVSHNLWFRLILYLKLFYLKKSNGLFVISENLYKFFLSRGFQKEKLHIVNMFVDIDRFKDLKKTKTSKYVAYCGTVSIFKDGVDDLLKAFSIFIKTHVDYTLYVIGNFSSEIVKQTLMKQAHQLDIADKVIFTGFVKPELIPQLLYDAQLLLLARPNNVQAHNGFPTKLGEYLATGNPVLITSVGNIPNFINDGINGFLSNSGDPVLFAHKMCEILDKPELAMEVGKMGKELANKEFSYLTQSNIVIKVMKSI